MLLIALLLAADVVSLTQESQVKDLCAALREQPYDSELDPAQAAAAAKAAQAKREEAAGRWYRLEVPSKGFVFGRYQAQDKQRELDGDRPLHAVQNTPSLDLAGVDGGSPPPTPARRPRSAPAACWSRSRCRAGACGTLKSSWIRCGTRRSPAASRGRWRAPKSAAAATAPPRFHSSRRSVGIGPGGAFAELDLERHDEIGCSAHLRHDNRADRGDFIRRSFEDELVVNLEEHPRPVLPLERLVDVEHRAFHQ